jgi:hypothetical protein
MNKHIILHGVTKLLAPLSHIGESTGTESFVNTIKIIGADMKPIEVFLYSGNAFRGSLRDHAAEYMMRGLNITAMPLETFYLFFSGGSIGGEQSIDIDQARRLRKALPMFSIFGGGVGNQLIEGKMNVGALYPICRETSHLLPGDMQDVDVSWRQYLTEQSYTRTDDAKNERLHQRFLAAPDNAMLPGGEAEDTKKKPERKPQQMRYTMELIAPGAMFHQRIDLMDMSELELGAFVSGLHEFRRHPFLGGNNRIGHGLCEITYNWRDADSNEWQPFITVGPDGCVLGEAAEKAKETYDRFLRSVYDDYLSGNKNTLAQLVSGEVAS